jgi:hypothetical protein
MMAYSQQSSSRKPFQNLQNVIPSGRVQQMKRVFQKASTSATVVRHHLDLHPPRSEIPIREWLTLPVSSFNVHYHLGDTTTDTESSIPGKYGLSVFQNMAVCKCPFEVRMQELRSCLQKNYPSGAALLYVREIFEPSDPEFRSFLLKHHHQPFVDVAHITKDQMDRLRIVIVDEGRRNEMIRYLKLLEVTPAPHVPLHYSRFKEEYSKLRDPKERLNKLLGFTFALNKYDCWLKQVSNTSILRVRMVKNLALRWKNLLTNRSLNELGIDVEFSLPAIEALLERFQAKVDQKLLKFELGGGNSVFPYKDGTK